MLKTVVGLSEIGNYLRHLGSFLHRYAWASTSRSPSIGPFEASSLIFQELYLRTVSSRSALTSSRPQVRTAHDDNIVHHGLRSKPLAWQGQPLKAPFWACG